MIYNIINLEERFKRDIERLFDLFKSDGDQLVYDHSQLETDDMITIEFHYHINYSLIFVQAKVLNRMDTITFEHDRTISLETDEQIRKVVKQGISYVWIQILEHLTGKKHDWGILTGIRPTKLYHRLSRKLPYDEVNRTLARDYLLKPNKIALLREIVQRQLQVIPDLYQIDEEVSLYIGIPFCPTKCAYCTFPAYAITGRNGTVEDFLKGLEYEIEQIGKWLKNSGRKVTTIYFGGGTPTSIEADQLDHLFQQLVRWIDLQSVREITVEAGRPDTITNDKIDVLNRWNVDRMSINPQTFTQETLNVIGRHHTVEETIEKFHLARQMNVNNINMDLIIGLPGETLKELQYSLEQIHQLQPESLTIHTMAFKRASYLTKNKEEFEITDPEEIQRMMDYATTWTKKNDYQPYYLYRQKNMLGNLENIGYSREGKESLYNILIMEEKQTIIGLGSGAVSKLIAPKSDTVIRFPNPKEPRAYIETVKESTMKKIKQLNQIFHS
ncbi:coproporphyrinogen III oxidase [Tepidibacillus fermentans]|uniref:Oxygen-independent coproporphyrinogen-3 oxidase n=1 Tax=Tepidibacillus fermentans TaxID=1281767 RepID=A0A4R3KKA6_9BACI|nr:coproporphyrinogen III oxidase [Tepidibacillus fermentans]TCS83825.1 oxygen-independent coproporphyrinogen-3 oxidase [Tepidibacillus fermentans]